MGNLRILVAIITIVVLKTDIASADVYTWTLDSTQSYSRLNLPDQSFTVPSLAVNVRPRSAFATGNTGTGSGNLQSDTRGAKATLSGIFQADYSGNSSVTLIDGSSDISASPSVPLDVAPNPAVWNSTTKSFEDDSTAPADFGSTIFMNIFNGLVNTKSPLAIRDFKLSLSSSQILLSGGNTIAPGSTTVGIQSASVQMKQSTLISGFSIDGVNSNINNLTVVNIQGGQINNLGGELRQMVLNYTIPIEIDLQTVESVSITGSISGVIVATATVPEVGPTTLVVLGLMSVGVPVVIRRRAWQV